MSRVLIPALVFGVGFTLAFGMTRCAQAADYVDPVPAGPPLVRKVPISPPIQIVENVRPLIDLPLFWSEVRRSQSADEVGMRIDARFRGVPVTFQGINVQTGLFQRVTILRAYRREDDAKIDLPAVTFDTITDGVPRTITTPLWSGVQVLP